MSQATEPRFDLSTSEGLLDLFKHEATITRERLHGDGSTDRPIMTTEECEAFLAICQGTTFKQAAKDNDLPSKMSSSRLANKAGGVLQHLLRNEAFPEAAHRIALEQEARTKKDLKTRLQEWEAKGRRGRRPGTPNKTQEERDIVAAYKDLKGEIRTKVGLQTKGNVPFNKMTEFTVERDKSVAQFAKDYDISVDALLILVGEQDPPLPEPACDNQPGKSIKVGIEDGVATPQ